MITMQHSRLFADISSNDEMFDAQSYANSGHLMVAIKATEGRTYENPRYLTWVLHAHLHHLAVAHYHFARPDLGNTPEQEASYFLEVVRHHLSGRDFLVLDLERGVKGSFKRDPQWSRDFDRYIQEHTRKHTVLYASRAVLTQSDTWLYDDNNRVWEADWSNDTDYAPRHYTVVFRQYTDGMVGPEPHTFTGIGRCDGNRMSTDVFTMLIRSAPHRCPVRGV